MQRTQAILLDVGQNAERGRSSVLAKCVLRLAADNSLEQVEDIGRSVVFPNCNGDLERLETERTAVEREPLEFVSLLGPLESARAGGVATSGVFQAGKGARASGSESIWRT